ncbi:FAD-dependent oxidoreductase [Humibacter sp. RRB41]|uniref:FAD-dependent oxidoreductase n=1 Tax=Humibacter sp. RRB41 TaxID=2919946 RepID=UPI001FA9F1A6|nr:FAD-dependent oxidoreductase [Humibacter sp. RRB41]
MQHGSILIIGGGIGGLSAAIALRQKGFGATVLERYPDMHASVFGVGIIQPGNALRALDAIGCADACVAAGYPAKQWGRMLDVAGDHVHDMPGVAIAGSTLPPLNGITRPRLHQILTDRALAVGVDIRYGTSIDTVDDDGDRVTARSDSGESFTADILIAADGVRSRVRRHVLGTEIEPHYIGQSAFRINIPRLPEIDCIVLQGDDRGMAGYVPIGPDLAYMFYNAHLGAHERIPEQELAPRLREYLARFGGLTARVRDEFIADDAEIVLRPEESIGVPTPWHKGRIVLMGDAVHAITPHLGQGAAQAIEDGVVLAEELASDRDVDAAFTAYTERRYGRCKLIVETSLAIGEWEMGRLDGFDNVAATNHVLEVMAQPL